MASFIAPLQKTSQAKWRSLLVLPTLKRLKPSKEKVTPRVELKIRIGMIQLNRLEAILV